MQSTLGLTLTNNYLPRYHLTPQTDFGRTARLNARRKSRFSSLLCPPRALALVCACASRASAHSLRVSNGHSRDVLPFGETHGTRKARDATTLTSREVLSLSLSASILRAFPSREFWRRKKIFYVSRLFPPSVFTALQTLGKGS